MCVTVDVVRLVVLHVVTGEGCFEQVQDFAQPRFLTFECLVAY